MMKPVNISVLKRLLLLWGKVYPYLTTQIMTEYGRDIGFVLEPGPFA